MFKKLQCYCFCSGLVFLETAGLFLYRKSPGVTLFWGQYKSTFLYIDCVNAWSYQVLKPFGNSLLVIAAMTYAKNNATIETMASLEVTKSKFTHKTLSFPITGSHGSLVLWNWKSSWKPCWRSGHWWPRSKKHFQKFLYLVTDNGISLFLLHLCSWKET